MTNTYSTPTKLQVSFVDAEESHRTSQTLLAPLLDGIVAKLLNTPGSVVTFEQIEAMMLAVGQDPFDASELYQAIIDTLEQRQILVVEKLASDEEHLDQDATANELADEVWAMLKQAQLPLAEYHHPVLPVGRERRLIEIYRKGKRAEAELSGSLNNTQRHAAARCQEAGIQALDELMRCNLRLITKTAIRFARHTQCMNLDDLTQEGRIGLLKAIERFDLSLNLRLSTYATWWIRQSIERAVGDNERVIRLPIHVQETLRKLKQERERYVAKNGVEPTSQQLAELLGLSITKVQLVCVAEQQAISLDMPVGSTRDTVLRDLIPDLRHYEPSRLLEHQLLHTTLGEMLDKLDERERRIIQLRFGLLDGHEQTLESIGREYGLTRERIRQIEVKALRRLGKRDNKRELRDFLV